MGHSTGLEDSYFKPTDQQILEGSDKIPGYISAIPDLTIYPTEEENQKLRKELAKTKTQHTKEWEILRQKVAEIEKRYRNMTAEQLAQLEESSSQKRREYRH